MAAARPDLIRFFSFASAATCSEDSEPGGVGGGLVMSGFMAGETAAELTCDTQSASLSHSCKTGQHPVARHRSGCDQCVLLLSRVSTARRYQGPAWTPPPPHTHTPPTPPSLS